MVHDSDLAPLSLTGRYAYGLACLEALCAAWAVDDPDVLGEIDAHWRALEVPKLCHWIDRHPYLWDDAFALRLASQLSADQVESLWHAFDEARDVAAAGCYCAPSDMGSMRAVLNVVAVLSRWGVSPPGVGRFLHAAWDGEFGWGMRHTRASFSDRAPDAESSPIPDTDGL